jgi:preprotein translocase subunit SecY
MTRHGAPTSGTGGTRGWRPAACLIAAFAVLAVGRRIPLPGLDREMVDLQLSGSADLLSRVSILALGIMPVLTAFAFARIVGLLPPVDRWLTRVPHAARWMRIGTVLVALGLTVLQGYGVLLAIAGSDLVAAPAGWFTAAGLAGFLGSTACLIWLAERSWPLGVWPLVCVAFLLSLPGELSTWMELWRMGVLRPADGLLPALYLVGATGLVVLCHAVLAGVAPAGPGGEAAIMEVLVWPPFLAGVAGALLLAPAALAFPMLGESALALGIVSAGLLAVLVPVFTWLAAERLWRPSALGETGTRLPVLLLVAVQLAVCLGGEWLLRASMGPVGLAGAPLIALVTTMLVIGRAAALPAWIAASAGEQRA